VRVCRVGTFAKLLEMVRALARRKEKALEAC
jgi:hypothetical protein